MTKLEGVFIEQFGKLYPATIFYNQAEARDYIEWNPEYMIAQEFHGDNPTITKQWHVVESDHKGYEVPALIRATITSTKGSLSITEPVTMYLENNFNADLDNVDWNSVYYNAANINVVNQLMHPNQNNFIINKYRLND